jgi:hypothetical protein
MAKYPWEFTETPCSQVGYETFFSKDYDDPKSGGTTDKSFRDAKKICFDCPFRVACADWGINYEIHGVWGGLTPKEREVIRKNRDIVLRAANPYGFYRVEYLHERRTNTEPTANM